MRTTVGPLLACALLIGTAIAPLGAVGAAPSSSADEALAAAVVARDDEALRAALARRPGQAEMARALNRAAAFGHRGSVPLFAAAGLDLRAAADDGWPPLLVALLNGHAGMARDLLAAGADPAARGPGDVTAADLAAALGDAELEARLRSPSAAADARLAAAVEANDPSAAAAALAAGAAVDARDPAGWTPLMHAAARGREEIVRLLLERRADPNAAASDGATPLSSAVLGGNAAVARRLLDAGAAADGARPPETAAAAVGAPRVPRPLVLAIAVRDEAMASLLLDRGANPGRHGNETAAPAQLAAAAGLRSLPPRLGGERRPPPPEAVAEAVARGDEATLRRLAEQGADLSSPLPQGLSPLHLAVVANQPAAVRFLVLRRVSALGINPLPGAEGGNILHSAVRTGLDWSAAHTLRDSLPPPALADLLRGADARGRTPLLLALMSGSPLWTLVEQSSPTEVLERADRDGVTPLLAAVARGNADAVGRLVFRGARTDLGPGRPSLQDIARSRRDWAVLAELPSDRLMPEGLRRGATSETRRELQRRLAQWGYYNGPVNGVFGPATVAAIRSFMQDRQNEVIQMAATGRNDWTEERGSGWIWRGQLRSPGAAGFYHHEWTSGESRGHSYFAYGPPNAVNTLVVYRYPNGQTEVMLTDQRRWEGAETFR